MKNEVEEDALREHYADYPIDGYMTKKNVIVIILLHLIGIPFVLGLVQIMKAIGMIH